MQVAYRVKQQKVRTYVRKQIAARVVAKQAPARAGRIEIYFYFYITFILKIILKGSFRSHNYLHSKGNPLFFKAEIP